MRTSRPIALLFGVLFAVGACASSSTTPAPATQPAASQPAASQPAASQPASQAAASLSAPVALTLWEHQKPRCDVLTKVLPDFEAAEKAAGKDVTVNLVCDVIEDEAFRQKVTLAYQGDTPPDVTSYPGAWVPDFSTAGYLLDITDRLNAWPDWAAHFYQVLRDRAQQADGKYYSMPRHGTVIELFLRKDVLDQNGISTEQPNSWDELITRLKDLHAKTGLPAITIPAGKTWGGGTFDEGFIHIFNGTGGTLYDAATGKWVVKSQALKDAFNFYNTLQTNGLLPDQGAARPAAVAADEVRRVHRHDGRWQGDPGRAAHHDPGIVGLGLRLGSRTDGRAPDPGSPQQGDDVGLPEQGRRPGLRLGRRGLDVDDLPEVAASGGGVRPAQVPQHGCAARRRRGRGRQPGPAR